MQKRLAASILKVGKSKVWMDPTRMKDIEQAITRADVRRLIMKGMVKKIQGKVKKPIVEGRDKRGAGSKKGTKYSIVDAKTKWIQTVRPLRRELKDLKRSERIDNQTYKQMRRLVKGGTFRSRSHLKLYLEQHGLLKKK